MYLPFFCPRSKGNVAAVNTRRSAKKFLVSSITTVSTMTH